MKHFLKGLFFAAVAMSFNVNAATIEKAKSAYHQGDYQQAALIAESLVASGHAEAKVLLGDVYYFGHASHIDYQKAFELYQSAARQGSADGIYSLAVMYEYGLGTKKDIAKALELFKQAAQKNQKLAQVKLRVHAL